LKNPNNTSLTTNSHEKEESIFKKSLIRSEKDWTKLAERFATGQISETLHQKMLIKNETEIYELKE